MQIRKYITVSTLGLLLLLSACQQAPAAPSEAVNSIPSTIESAETTGLIAAVDSTSPVVTTTAEATAVSEIAAMEDPLQATETSQAETESAPKSPTRAEPSQPAPSESANPADTEPTEPPKPTEPAPTQPVHTHSYKMTVVAPTCNAKGYTEHKCACGDVYGGSYKDALGHSFSEQIVAATCTSGGYTLKACSRCGATEKSNETPALGHDYRETVISPTTSSEGYTEHKCSRCGDGFMDNYTPKLKVSYDIYQVMAAGNNYAQSRGCIVDTSMTASDSSYYPADEVYASHLAARNGQSTLNELAKSKVQSTIDRLVAADGSEDELPYTRIRCYIEYHESTDSYEIWVFYG